MITFFLQPAQLCRTFRRSPPSVSTRVVSWNEAAEMKLSVDSEAQGDPDIGSAARRRRPPDSDHLAVLLVEDEAGRPARDDELRVAGRRRP